jgi:hypothetical protein
MPSPTDRHGGPRADDAPRGEARPRRGPFDHLGVLALVWATLFAAAAVGLSMALG